MQTAFYADFAWVYWTRQRVKLRNGAVVDSDDLSRGFLVSKLVGGQQFSGDEENITHGDDVNGDHEPPRRPGTGGGWGARAVSVSADDGVYEARTTNKGKTQPDAASTPQEIQNIFGDDSDSDADEIPPSIAGTAGVGNGSEWQKDGN